MAKVLLTEPINEAGMEVLRGRVETVVSPDPSEKAVGRLMGDADAVIVRTATRITRPMIEGATSLKVISRTGGGLDNVDVQAATDCSVVVCGVKGPQDRFVAEHAVALIATLAKQLFYLDGETRKGNFHVRFEYRPTGLSGKRVGLIGVGRIGRIVGEICVKGLGMEVSGYDPYVRPEELEETGIILTQDLKELMSTADFLSLHVPLTEETRGFMGDDQFGLMKSTAFLINTSRGEVVQEPALVNALSNRVIAGAGIDVFEEEPPHVQNPLFQLRNVIVSPHSAALTNEAVAKLAQGAAENVINVLEGRRPSYSVNWEEIQTK